jgi:hypothetical protein
MRLGLLKAARASFNKARLLLGDEFAQSLDNNFAALDETDTFAESIGHNPSAMFERFRLLAPAEDPTAHETLLDPFQDDEIDFVLDLSSPFGVGLTPDAVVDNVKDGGQFSRASAKHGDKIVAAGVSPVETLQDFKDAISSHKSDGVMKLVVTLTRKKGSENGDRKQGKPSASLRKGFEGHCDDGVNIEVWHDTAISIFSTFLPNALCFSNDFFLLRWSEWGISSKSETPTVRGPTVLLKQSTKKMELPLLSKTVGTWAMNGMSAVLR